MTGSSSSNFSRPDISASGLRANHSHFSHEKAGHIEGTSTNHDAVTMKNNNHAHITNTSPHSSKDLGSKHIRDALSHAVFPASQIVGKVQPARSKYSQPAPIPKSLFDLGLPLDEVEFVIVDVETTGIGSDSHLLEVGAVLMCAGQVRDTFSSLINPGKFVPPKITTLTGITNSMVATAPSLAQVINNFDRFASWKNGRVFVAHSASFDLGFIKRAYEALDLEWYSPPVIDTLTLARRVLPRPLIARHNLGTLAKYFSTEIPPNHRALDDALATAEVLQGMLTMLAKEGIDRFDDLQAISKPVPYRRKRQQLVLTSEVEQRPGVYYFLNEYGDILYIGSSAQLRSRLNSYFTAAEKRQHITRSMIDSARNIRVRYTPNEFLARIYELRDIALLKPPYNRKSKRPDRHWFIVPQVSQKRLEGDSPHKAIRIVKRVPTNEQSVIGPFPSRKSANQAAELLTGSMLYSASTADALSACKGDCRAVINRAYERMVHASVAQRFEEAADHRRRIHALLIGLRRAQLHIAVANDHKLLLAIPVDGECGGWHYVGSSYGRVVIQGRSTTPESLEPTLSMIDNMWPKLSSPTYIGSNTTWDEVDLITKLLIEPGTRIINTSSTYACHINGAYTYWELWDALNQSRKS